MMLTLKRFFRRKKSIPKPQIVQRPPPIRNAEDETPFPVPKTGEQEEIMLVIALSLSEHTYGSEQSKDESNRDATLSKQERSVEALMASLKLDQLENFNNDQDDDDTCSICFGNMFERSAHMLLCCHMFCKQCIKAHITVKVGAEIFPIICPICQEVILEEDVREVCGTDVPMYTRWLDLSFKSHLESNRDTYYHCPTPNCPSIMEKGILDIVRCSTCGKSACIRCYNDHDENVSCEEYTRWKELNSKADDVFKSDVVKKIYQKCPGCKRFVVKVDGCNHLTCRCGRKFNWIE